MPELAGTDENGWALPLAIVTGTAELVDPWADQAAAPPTDPPPCRSVSPDGDKCTKGQHKRRWHQRLATAEFTASRRWEGKGANARWEVIDDGYRSEGEYSAMRMSGVRW